MKYKLLIAAIVGGLLAFSGVAYATTVLMEYGGGTGFGGVSNNVTPGAILFGNYGLSTLATSTNLTFATSTNTLTTQNLVINGSCTGSGCGSGGASFGQDFNFVTGTPNYLTGTTSPLGLILTASSTIGDGTKTGGLTISGNATTTGALNLHASVSSSDPDITFGPTGAGAGAILSSSVSFQTVLGSFGVRINGGNVATGVQIAQSGTIAWGAGNSAPDVFFTRLSAGVLGVGTAIGGSGGSIIAGATSTIGNGTQGGGLTISGGATTTGNLTLSALTGTQCLHEISGLVSGTGSDCGSGGGGSSFGEAWALDSTKSFLIPTTTVGIIVSASSTIGNGTQTGGLTINGGATTTGLFIGSAGTVGAPSIQVGGGSGLYENSVGVLGISNGVSGISWNGTAFYPNTDSLRDIGIAATNRWNNLFVNHIQAFASSTIGDGTQGGGLTISGGATTTGNHAITGNLTVGGTLTGPGSFVLSSASSFRFNVNAVQKMLFGTGDWRVSGDNALCWTSGTSVGSGDTCIGRNAAGVVQIGSAGTNNANGTLLAATIGIGTTSPFGELAVGAQNGSAYPGNLLFNIASSTALATTTLFSVSNTGAVNAAGGNLTVNSAGLITAGGTAFSNNYGLVTGGGINVGGGALSNVAGGQINLYNASAGIISINTSGIQLFNNALVGWSSTGASNGTNDTRLSRLSAGVLSVDTTTTGNSSGTLIAGKLAVGSTTPYALLSVAGASNGTSNLFAISTSTSAATTTTFLIDKNGNETLTGSVTWPYLPSCSGSNALNTNSSGTVVCGAVSGGSGTVTSVTAATPNSTLIIGGTNPITTSGTINFDINPANPNIWTALQQFSSASTSLQSIFKELFVGGTSTTTIFGDGATSKFASAVTIATTSPTALTVQDIFGTNALQVNTASTTGSIFVVQATSTSDTLFSVDQYGHLMASSTPATPTVSCTPSGGTLSANSNDDVGTITTGTLSTACTITFGRPYVTTPVVSADGSTAFAGVTSQSTSAFTVTMVATTGNVINYIIVQP